MQDESFAKEELKKYKILKIDKRKEKSIIYHNMFLNDISSILLIDGYSSNGKILYASQNFSLLFSFNGKELLNLNIDELIPSVIENFHKKLIDNVMQFTNINNIFNKPKDSFLTLKNKKGELFQIKLFISLFKTRSNRKSFK